MMLRIVGSDEQIAGFRANRSRRVLSADERPRRQDRADSGNESRLEQSAAARTISSRHLLRTPS